MSTPSAATSSTLASLRPPLTFDELIDKHATHLQSIYDERTAGDHTFTGVLTGFAEDLIDLIEVTVTLDKTS